MNAKQLEKLLHKEIPITQALAVEVLTLDPEQIIVKAPFSENKNIHNTAFAGSIYTTATLAGWSLLTNYLKLNGIQGAVVLAKADMQYLKPINGDILAHCSLPDSDLMDQLAAELNLKNRAKIALTIEVKEQNRCKARMVGQFAVV